MPRIGRTQPAVPLIKKFLSKTTVLRFDYASNSGYQAASSTYSWTHTCSWSDRFLAVDISVFSVPGTTVSSITYNGVALSLIGLRSSVTGALHVECWGLVNPTSGPNTIAVTLSTSVISSGTAVSYSGVDQTTPYEAFNSNQATNVGAADATVSITTITDNDWVHAVVATDDGSVVAGQTSRNNVTGAAGTGANEDTNGVVTPAGIQAMSYTGVGAAATWVIGSYGLRQVQTNASAVGSSTNTSTAVAIGTGKARVVGASSNTSTTSATGIGKCKVVGASSNTSTASAIGTGIDRAVGSSTNTSTILGIGIGKCRVVGSSTNTSTASAITSNPGNGVGVSTNTSTAAGIGTARCPVVGSNTNTSTTAAIVKAKCPVVGSSTNTSTTNAIGSGSARVVGSSTNTSNTAAVGKGSASAVGSSTNTSTANAVGRSKGQTVGSSTNTSTATGIAPPQSSATGLSTNTSTATAVSTFVPGVGGGSSLLLLGVGN